MFQMSSLVSFQTPGLKGEANTKCPEPIFFSRWPPGGDSYGCKKDLSSCVNICLPGPL